MESILLSFVIVLLCIYAIFALWQITIICGPEPENGEFHTQNELEVNWKINRPPILYYGYLPVLVANNLLFYWMASILSIILIYIKTYSLLSTLLSAFLFFAGAFVSLRILKAIALIWIKKHWQRTKL
jgi:hypothetical protein